jgi:nucleotide-binding universal stress UspA family protein
LHRCRTAGVVVPRAEQDHHAHVKSSPVLIATDLSANAEPALVRGRAHAEAIGSPWLVCHVVPDVVRHHPLAPSRDENDVALVSDLTKKAAELVTEQVGRVLGASPDDYRVIVEVGRAEDEVVRVAEEEGVALVVIGARPRHGVEKVLGHVAERIVRYGHTSVLVARPGIPDGKVLVATDFTDGSMPSVRFAAMLVATMKVDATLLHVMQLPTAPLASLAAAFGSPWMPPSQGAVAELEELGRSMLDALAEEHGFAHVEQVEGTPAEMIVARAHALGVEMIVMGSRGHTALVRLVLGSTAERVIRHSDTSVLIAR